MNLSSISSTLFPDPPNPHVIGKEPVAAVALIVVDNQLFMIKRAEKEGDPWSGHMAFPGGRYETQDEDLRSTAERETFEEVGIKLDASSYLGPITPLNHPRLTVYAYVYQLDQKPLIKINEEVERYFWFSFESLLEPNHQKPYEFTYQAKVMTFPSIQAQNVTIWGITFQFLSDLLSRITE